jgi:hypothetical protein
MRLDMFVGINIEPALEQSGCPICRIRNNFEMRYLSGLLHEYVNDYESRIQIIASLGYCTKHAWQMGLMERDKYGDAVGNAIIYENLVKVALKPLAEYQKKYQSRPNRLRDRFTRWLKKVLGQPGEVNQDPYRPFMRSTCRVCQTGENGEKNYLEWLLAGLSEPEPVLRETYLQSDGLCLRHLRQALLLQTGAVESGAQFLVDQMIEKLPKLCLDLREYTDKHAWGRHTEAMTPDEGMSWIRAFAFLPGMKVIFLLTISMKFQPMIELTMI